jgi:hypothetical protein
MAKLSRVSAAWPTEGIAYPKGDWDALYKAEKIALQKYMDASDALKENDILGAVISFPRGDGHAIYRVCKETPLTLEHIPDGDCWQVEDALIRGLTKQDILLYLKHKKAMRKLFGGTA